MKKLREKLLTFSFNYYAVNAFREDTSGRSRFTTALFFLLHYHSSFLPTTNSTGILIDDVLD